MAFIGLLIKDGIRQLWLDVPPSTPVEYLEVKDSVEVQKNLEYPSQFGENLIDIYYPKDDLSLKPTILWVHGGAFVSGSKDSIAVFATLLASNNYVVVTMNYELSPESHFPSPLQQVDEVIHYLRSINNYYPMMDLERFVIGGDSAGAHIAANYTVFQLNLSVQNGLGISKNEFVDIDGILLYCGPYDLMEFAQIVQTRIRTDQRTSGLGA